MKVWFPRFIVASLALTYLVILAGAVVRTTGSGMGCPDWPKCFGQYIPPTDISQLPANYKEVNKVAGHEIADFDAFKTWTEYINRLMGALLGIAALGAFVTSFSFRAQTKRLMLLSGLSLFLILLAAWLGAKVVYSNLAVSSITIHMLVSFAIVTTIVVAINQYRNLVNPLRAIMVPTAVRNLFVLVIALFVLQVILGTQVRESVDALAKDGAPRDRWIELLTGTFQIHRTFSLVWSALLAYLGMQVFKYYRQNSAIYTPLLLAGVITFLEVATGAVMSYFAVPAAVQPIHLLFSASIFGLMMFSFVSMVTRQRVVIPPVA